MKLELKHIACYLPFDLQYKGEYGGVSTMRKLEYCRPYNKETDSFTDEIGVDGYFIQYIKPLLYPISCLTEEIEHNGERFVPIERVKDDMGNKWADVCEDWVSFLLDDIANADNIIQKCPHDMWEHFVSYHIDVFALIPAGLAVDKREVKHG